MSVGSASMATPPLPGSGKLRSLDAGRFVAALLVALFHGTFTVINFGGAAPFGAIWRGGHAGVEYFFVLSGFIILYAHRRDVDRPTSIPGYLRKRATRILPMLWLVLMSWGVLRMVLAEDTTTGVISWWTLLLDMLLVPHSGPMVLGVTWTLQRELVFYLLFAVALLNRRAGVVTLGIWQAAVVGVAIFGIPLGPASAAVFGFSNIGFGMGLLIAIYGERVRVARPRALAGIGALSFAALLVLEWRIGGALRSDFHPLGDVGGVLAYTIAAGVCITGMVQHDLRKDAGNSPIIAALGDSAYVLYLVHPPIGSLMIRLIHGLGLPPEAQLIILVVAAVAGAVAIHLLIEKPILRFLRNRSPARSQLSGHDLEAGTPAAKPRGSGWHA